MLTQNVNTAADILKKGGVGAIPTETVYGLGALAFCPEAVARVYEIKQRPLSHPLIVHIAEPLELENLVTHLPSQARQLIQKFWPGPLTIVLPKKKHVPDIVSAGLDSIGVRCPAHPVIRELIRLCQMPIAAPSANLFGQLSATTAQQVEESLGKQIDFVLDGGACPVGVESTIVSFLEETPKLLRHGGISLEEMEAVIGPIALAQKKAQVIAPGMLENHYSPRTPLLFLKEGAAFPETERTGLLCLKKPATLSLFNVVEELSAQGNLREAAANLFSALYRLDKQNLNQIIAYELPNEGLGRAVNDRLQRASLKN